MEAMSAMSKKLSGGRCTVTAATKSEPMSMDTSPNRSAVAIAASDPLDDRGRAHASAGAHRDEPRGEAAPPQLAHERPDEHPAGRTDRMAERDGAAVDVALLPVHAGVTEEL